MPKTTHTPEKTAQLIERFRANMDITRDYTYLNHASCGPLTKPIRRAMNKFGESQSRLGSEATQEWLDFIPACRKSVARYLGVKMDSIALLTNTTVALIRALSSIQLKPGDEVLCLDDEFPALYYALQGCCASGAVVREVPIPHGADATHLVLSAITDRTRIVGVSWVSFLQGYRVDLNALSEEKRKRGFYLVVDGIQGVGAVPMYPKELAIDFLAVGGEKWMLSPLGSAFLYVNPAIVNKHVPQWPGWYGMDIDFSKFTRRGVPPKQGAVRYDTGTSPFPSLYGMKRAVDDMARIGQDAIWERVNALCEQIITGLRTLKLPIITPQAAEKRAGIVTFAVENPDAVMAVMKERKVVMSLRDGLLRVSPHFWNTPAEVDVFLRALKEAVG
jgi:cysteine desulfurase/selenocysteine lyase